MLKELMKILKQGMPLKFFILMDSIITPQKRGFGFTVRKKV